MDSGGAADVCTESKCAAYSFGTGLVANETDGCSSGIQLTTNSDTSCAVKCDSTNGYVAQTGTITCSSTASEGDATSGEPSCVACPSVADGTCTECSDSSTCTAVSCDDYYLDSNGDASDGCEAHCGGTTSGSNVCSSTAGCGGASCDDGNSLTHADECVEGSITCAGNTCYSGTAGNSSCSLIGGCGGSSCDDGIILLLSGQQGYYYY